MKQSIYKIKNNVIKKFGLGTLFFVYGGIDYKKEIIYIYVNHLQNRRYINKMWNDNKRIYIPFKYNGYEFIFYTDA